MEREEVKENGDSEAGSDIDEYEEDFIKEIKSTFEGELDYDDL